MPTSDTTSPGQAALDAAGRVHKAWRLHKRGCRQCVRHELRGLCPTGQALNGQMLDAELAVDRALGTGGLAAGTRVAYHGSLAALHGTYLAGRCGCGSCGASQHELRDDAGALIAEHVSRSSITLAPAPSQAPASRPGTPQQPRHEEIT